MDQPADISLLVDALSYRTQMKVSAVRCFRRTSGRDSFPICPRCLLTMEREYQSYCDRCGQALDWMDFDHAIVVL